jgi:Flp pilus assembly protein TadG
MTALHSDNPIARRRRSMPERLLQRLRRRGGEEDGVVLVIVALLMTAMLGMAAVAIDLGSFWQAQRQAQAAADAGALAASQDLPSSTSAATTDAQTYVQKNYPGATVTVSAPYNSSTSQVKVTVNATTPSFFGKIFGLTKADVSASAVAGAGTTGGAKSAIFAKSTTCNSALSLEAGGLTLNGGVRSNGGIIASGHGNTYASGSYSGPASCWQDNSGGSNTFGGSTSPTIDPTNYPWPEDYTSDFSTPFSSGADPNCTFIGTDLNLQNQSGQTLVSGTYCYQTIEFNSSNLTCTCTFVASSSIQFNQGPDNFIPYYKDLQFYDMDSNNVNINSNGTSFLTGGTVFIPNSSQVTINAPSGTVSGFIEGQSVIVNGGGPTTWNGTGTPVGGSATPPSLVQ